MPNEKELLDELEFAKYLKTMSDRELLLFACNEVYKASLLAKKMRDEVFGVDGTPGLKARLNSLERFSKDSRKLIIAMWVLDGAIICALLSLFIQHLGS